MNSKKIITTLLVSFTLLITMFGFYNIVYAHDWYDKDCCDKNDCAPVIKREKTHNGWILTTKFGSAFLPQRILDDPKDNFNPSIRQSQDLKWHACIVKDAEIYYLRCVYLPLAF